MYEYKKVKKDAKEILSDGLKLYTQTFLPVLAIAVIVAIFSTFSFYKAYITEEGVLLWQQQLLWFTFEGLLIIISSLCISVIYIIMHSL